MLRSVFCILDNHACLLKQQSADRHGVPLRHIILIPTNQSFLFLFNAARLSEMHQIPNFIVFGLTDLVSNPRSTTLDAIYIYNHKGFNTLSYFNFDL